MDAPTQTPSAPHFKPMTLALAGFGLLLSVSLTVLFTQLKPEYRVWNVSALGALALFSAARLGLVQGLVFTAVALALKDLCLYLTTDWWRPSFAGVFFVGYVLIGWYFLRRTGSVVGAVGAALGGGLLFFLTSNFGSWWGQALPYGYSFEGLVNCYVAAIPFYRGTFLGDVVFSAALFGAQAVLSRAYFPAERVGVAAQPIRNAEGNW